MKDVDFLLAGGEIFALVVYAQLILENAPHLRRSTDDLVDQIFDFMVRDFSKFAPSSSTASRASTAKQMACCLRMIRKPVDDAGALRSGVEGAGAPLSGAYEMNG